MLHSAPATEAEFKRIMNIQMPENPSFLVILPNNLGDVIMATPVLEGLAVEHPGSTVAFLVEKGFEAGVINSPYCNKIISIDRKEIRRLLRGENWREGRERLRAFVEDINAVPLTAIVNLCQVDYISYLVTLLSAERKVGRRFLHAGNHAIPDVWSQYLYAIPFSRTSNRLHACDVYRRIAGVTTHSGGYSIALTQQELDRAQAYLSEKGIGVDSGQRIMIFQPGAAYDAKRWPVENFVRLGKMLMDKGWQVVLCGADAERPLADRIHEELGGACVNTAGETTFRQAVALVAHAHGCVTGDTALMHASSGLGVPVYALFGATNPVETGPYGDGHWVFSATCEKRPCFEYRCESKKCLSIDPRTVFSCITDNHPGNEPECDVFRTSLENNGDYALLPVGSSENHYVEPDAAEVTLRTAGESPGAVGFVDETNAGEIQAFLATIREMRQELQEYIRTQDLDHIRNFESVKSDFNALHHCGSFCAAFLHIRLNSVPLLDPLEGVRETERQCEFVEQAVSKALERS